MGLRVLGVQRFGGSGVQCFRGSGVRGFGGSGFRGFRVQGKGAKDLDVNLRKGERA